MYSISQEEDSGAPLQRRSSMRHLGFAVGEGVVVIFHFVWAAEEEPIFQGCLTKSPRTLLLRACSCRRLLAAALKELPSITAAPMQGERRISQADQRDSSVFAGWMKREFVRQLKSCVWLKAALSKAGVGQQRLPTQAMFFPERRGLQRMLWAMSDESRSRGADQNVFL